MIQILRDLWRDLFGEEETRRDSGIIDEGFEGW